MPLALIFPPQHGAGLETPVHTRVVAVCEAIQELYGVGRSSPPKACSWMCQHRKRATRSLLKAGGDDDRKVARQRERSASRSSDRIWSISASIASRSDERGVMLVVPPWRGPGHELGTLAVGVRRLGFFLKGFAGNDAVHAIALGLFLFHSNPQLLPHNSHV